MVSRIAGALIVLIVALPLFTFALSRRSLVGLTEESTGYRYLHSLRILTSQDRPWTPQGFLPGVAHELIQVVLTGVGASDETLYPRIDVWLYAAALLPHLLAVAAYWWAVRPLAGWLRLLIAAGALVVTFSPQASGGWHAFQPDYQSWALPAAFVMLGALARLERCASTGVSGLRLGVLVGIFGGLCLAVKPTYPYPAPLFVWLLIWRPRSLLMAVPVAGGVNLLTLLVYYVGDLQAVLAYPSKLAMFGGAVTTNVSLVTWWWTTATTWTLGSLACWLLPALVVWCVLGCWRKALPLTLGLAFALAIASRREASVTWQEAHAYTLAALALIGTRVPACRLAGRAGRLVVAVGLALILGWTEMRVNSLLANVLWQSERTARIGELVDDFLVERQPAAVVASHNGLRLLTHHTALAKGTLPDETTMMTGYPITLRFDDVPRFEWIWGDPLEIMRQRRHRRVVYVSGSSDVSRVEGWTCALLEPSDPNRFQQVIGCRRS